MITLIEISCSVSKEETVQTTVEAFCKETGGLLIGRCIYEEIDVILLIVQLPLATSVNKQATFLSHALQQEDITSFQYVNYDLVQISFDPSVNLREQMRDFPLCSGESWFPAIHDPHQAYLCISRPLMVAKQIAWILGHEAAWAFL